MVLYHCCMSLAKARQIERDGFGAYDFVRVTDQAPDIEAHAGDDSHAVVFLGLPLGFQLEDFPLADDGTGNARQERIIPASILNQFPRAVWPD